MTPKAPDKRSSRVDRWFYWLTATMALFLLWAVSGISHLRAEEGIRVPSPVLDEHVAQDAGLETAVFAGGCF